MTSFAFVLGTVPLAIATGASANSRHSIGTGVIGGTLAATVDRDLLHPDVLLGAGDAEREAVRRKEVGRSRCRGTAPPDARRRRRRAGAATEMRTRLRARCVCSAARRLHGRPGLPPPRGRRARERTSTRPTTSTDTANIEWWKQFDDPVLDQLIVEALAEQQERARSPPPTSSRPPACSRPCARRSSRSSATRATAARQRFSHATTSLRRARRIPTNSYQAFAERELGDRSVGAHPPPDRSRRRRTCSPPTRRGAA